MQDAIEFVDKLGVILSDASDGRITTVRSSNSAPFADRLGPNHLGFLSHVSDCTPGSTGTEPMRNFSVSEVQSDA
jgi:hypothetical protein